MRGIASPGSFPPQVLIVLSKVVLVIVLVIVIVLDSTTQAGRPA